MTEERLKQLFNQMCGRPLLAPLEDHYSLSPPFASDLLGYCLDYAKSKKRVGFTEYSTPFTTTEILQKILEDIGIPNAYAHFSHMTTQVVYDQIYHLCEFGNGGHFILNTDRLLDLNFEMQGMVLTVDEKERSFQFDERKYHPFLNKKKRR